MHASPHRAVQTWGHTQQAQHAARYRRRAHAVGTARSTVQTAGTRSSHSTQQPQHAAPCRRGPHAINNHTYIHTYTQHAQHAARMPHRKRCKAAFARSRVYIYMVIHMMHHDSCKPVVRNMCASPPTQTPSTSHKLSACLKLMLCDFTEHVSCAAVGKSDQRRLLLVAQSHQ